MKTWWNLLINKISNLFSLKKPQMPKVMTMASLMANGVTYATWDDLEQFEFLQKAAYQGYMSWRKKDFQNQWQINPYALYLVYKKEDKVLGLLHARLNYRAHISNILVDPAFQGQGIGTQLMEQFFHLVDQLDVFQVTLEVRASNIIAQHFYHRFNFKEVKRVAKYYPNNKEDAIQMQWERG